MATSNIIKTIIQEYIDGDPFLELESRRNYFHSDKISSDQFKMEPKKKKKPKGARTNRGKNRRNK